MGMSMAMLDKLEDLYESEIPKQEYNEVEEEMLRFINQVKEYSERRGTLGGLSWGSQEMEHLNWAFDGLNPGLILIAGQANAGKSAFCMHLAWEIAKANREVNGLCPNKAYVLYFSLDDNLNDLLPRFIAIDQRVPINVVRAPNKYKDKTQLIERMNAGYDTMRKMLHNFKMVDSRQGSSIEFIEQEIKRHQIAMQQKDPAYKLVVFIDNFHDITVEHGNFQRGDDGAKYDYLAGELSRICTQQDIPVICTAELRKLNNNRRPTMDDIRETVKIAYEAKAILLCYNEVGLRGEAASIFYARGGAEFEGIKQPVFEVKIGKNKFASFKGRLFFEFMPELSYMKAATKERSEAYTRCLS